jgi:hypothetical protein
MHISLISRFPNRSMGISRVHHVDPKLVKDSAIQLGHYKGYVLKEMLPVFHRSREVVRTGLHEMSTR